MNDQRVRSALVGAVMTDPTSALNAEFKAIGVDAAWDRIIHGHRDVPDGVRARLARFDVDAALRRADRIGARIVVPGDHEWPIGLTQLGAAEPWALWVRGSSLEALNARRSVAIVGARACTDYGKRVASEFASGISAHGNSVISGGAYGIDVAAHLGALASDGNTVVVLASGVDVAYPRAHFAIFERIAECGALVSEAMPGAGVTKPAFLVRNRIIAALGYGTVVVEARLRSGSISTFVQARELHRILMAVPGNITNPESGGTNALLKEDAKLVTSAADVLSLVEPLGSVLPDAVQAPNNEWDDLSPQEREVHELLPAHARISVDRIVDQSGLSLHSALAALAMLAGRGIVAEDFDGSWRRARKLRGASA